MAKKLNEEGIVEKVVKNVSVDGAIASSVESLGYTALKDKQTEILVNVLSGNDVFGVLPTWYVEDNLWYTCLPKAWDIVGHTSDSVVVVVTPQLKIIEDQVASLNSRGLKAVTVNEERMFEMPRNVLEDIVNGEYQLVFLTPDSLIGHHRWRRMLRSEEYKEKLKTVVFDEAHTIAKWTQDEEYRSMLLQIGDLRSRIPTTVRLMALTGSGTPSVNRKVMSIIGMNSPLQTYVSPYRSNIVYKMEAYESISVTFRPLLEAVKEQRVNHPRVIIYCQKYEHCSSLYMFFKYGLGRGFTEPAGAPDLSQFRLVDMFHGCTTKSMKETIAKQFAASSCLRILMIAFAHMGPCYPDDVKTIIHLGAPDSIESYIEETGRAGKNGEPASALLLMKKKWKWSSDDNMRAYFENTTECRRHVLFHEYEDYATYPNLLKCLCCDICKAKCDCNECIQVPAD